MDGYKAKESTSDCVSGAAEPTTKQEKRKRASAELGVVDEESASAEWQREIDALYEYYKEVSVIVSKNKYELLFFLFLLGPV